MAIPLTDLHETKAFDPLIEGDGEKHGKYLISLVIRGQATQGVMGEYQATVKFWEIKSRFGPGPLDIMQYVCSHCLRLLAPELAQMLTCPFCFKPLQTEYGNSLTFEEQVFKGSLGDIAATLVSHFYTLCESNADILVRRDRYSGTAKAVMDKVSLHAKERNKVLDRVKSSVESVGYSLGRIEKDQASGRSLRTCFLTLLKA